MARCWLASNAALRRSISARCSASRSASDSSRSSLFAWATLAASAARPLPLQFDRPLGEFLGAPGGFAGDLIPLVRHRLKLLNERIPLGFQRLASRRQFRRFRFRFRKLRLDIRFCPRRRTVERLGERLHEFIGKPERLGRR
ncbi:MAG: hypothetical protein MZV65_30205 [Chromatiales bacterium]|nr:hypothetical protein [Chromatiales bacterium]